MQLEVSKRNNLKKSEINNIRKEGNIPAVVYAKGSPNGNITINGSNFKNFLSKLNFGDLSTTIFTVKDEKETYKALIKDIQYRVTSYDVTHVDLLRVSEDVLINVKVPIRIIGEAESKGIKLGGTLKQVINAFEVRCLPKDLPKEFIVSIADLDFGQAIRLEDIKLPKNVTTRAMNLKEVAVTIGKR